MHHFQCTIHQCKDIANRSTRKILEFLLRQPFIFDRYWYQKPGHFIEIRSNCEPRTCSWCCGEWGCSCSKQASTEQPQTKIPHFECKFHQFPLVSLENSSQKNQRPWISFEIPWFSLDMAAFSLENRREKRSSRWKFAVLCACSCIWATSVAAPCHVAPA